MNKAKRVLALLLCLAMVLAYVPSHIHAAGGEPNIIWDFRAGESGSTVYDPSTPLQPGDTFRIRINCTEMTLMSFACGFEFDTEVFEVTKTTPAKLEYWDTQIVYDEETEEEDVVEGWFEKTRTSVSTPAEASESGAVGVVFAGDTEYRHRGKLVLTITLKVKDDAPLGSTDILFFEDSSGTDGYKSAEIAGSEAIMTQVLTIGSSEPACEHTNTKLVANNNGTHNVVCADCDAPVKTNVACTADDDNNHTTDDSCVCGYVVNAAVAHKDVNKDHVCDYGCDVRQGEHKSNATSACKAGICEYCQATMPATAEHTYTDACDDDCDRCGATREVVHVNTTTTTTATCYTPGIETTVCDDCGDIVSTTTVPATGNHTDAPNDGDHNCDTTGCPKTDVTSHTPGEPVINTTPATNCTEEGKETTETFCTECHTRLSYAEKSLGFGDHNWGTVAYNWSADYTSCTAVRTCEKGCEETAEADVITSVLHPATCVSFGWTNLVADFDVDWAVDQNTNIPNIPVNSNNHNGVPNSTTYADNGDGYHTVTVTCQCNTVLSTETVAHTYVDGKCVCEAVEHVCEPDEYINNGDDHTVKCECGAVLGTEAHDYTNDAEAHKCVCGAIEMFTLTVCDLEAAYGDADADYYRVPFGTNILDFLDDLEISNRYDVDNETRVGYYRLDNWNDSDCNLIESDTTVTADLEIWAAGPFCGWERYDEEAPWSYSDELGNFVEGWYKIDGAWYYFVKAENGWHYIAQGLTRVPYPTEAINGITYAPNAEDLAYAASKGETFKDATEAWFVFGNDGKFQNELTGIQDSKYVENGMIAWHSGAVKVDGEAYYFVGDPVNGGNMMAQGDVYTTRCNGINAFVEGACYNFKNGKLSGVHGMVDGKYYENSRLMFANGLTKVEEGYIYVNRDGKYITNVEYWVPANNLGVVPGMYQFDENGFMVDPVTTDKNGVYNENGEWRYYIDGKVAYGLGLIEITAPWYGAGDNGGVVTAVVYVKSNGTLATGTYYVTNVANAPENLKHLEGLKQSFGNYGRLYFREGVINGKYYVNNMLAYNAGVVEIEEGKYIYVRSNGEVVVNCSYWITNVGETGVLAQKYSFDENGYFTPVFQNELKNGIVDGFYYVDGKIAYCAGLIKLADENGEFYIYVRSNGELATGSYWPTNKNGIDVKGALDFGVDGKSYI